MKNYLLVLLMPTLLLLGGCQKEGCTNPEATNYEDKADKDDGSCTFEGNLVLWYDGTTESIMQLYNITELRYIVGGVDLGSFAISDYVYSSAPPCGVNGSIGRGFVFDENVTQSVDYVVYDQNSIERFSGTISLPVDGSCTSEQLVW